MIKIFFTEEGYYVIGNGVEIARRCSPALTDRGDRIFQPIHHEYKILYLALAELQRIDSKEDAIVYGSSRIIDEINGLVKPLDEINSSWLQIIRQDILPTIKAVVFFRKKSPDFVQREISAAHGTLMAQVDRRTLTAIAEKEIDHKQNTKRQRKRGLIGRLRDKWFGDNDGIRNQ